MLWICFALLTALVVLALARPLLAPADADLADEKPDAAIYRDQLAEIETDRERGLIGDAEAEAARNEIARRLLSASRAANDKAGPSEARQTTVSKPHAKGGPSNAWQGVLAAVPFAGIALYSVLGSPNLPGQPLASRQAVPTAQTPVDELVARVEAELKKNPNDVRGWSAIAPVYLRLKRYEDAAYAYSQILGISGESVDALMGFAEASLLGSQGVVNDNVKRAAARLIEIKPEMIEPKIWLALGKEQSGDTAGAIADYEALVAKAEPNAPWAAAVKKQIDKLKNGGPASASPAPGPATAPGAAAEMAALPPEEQQKRITAMVDGLAARLKKDGNDLEGWLRLVRAYQVMGRKADATTALADARTQFAADPKALEQLSELARSVGL